MSSSADASDFNRRAAAYLADRQGQADPSGRPRRSGTAKRSGFSPTSLVTGALIGLIAAYAARFLRMMFSNGWISSHDALIPLAKEAGIALVVGLLIWGIFRPNAKTFLPANVAGIVAMIAMMQTTPGMAPSQTFFGDSAAWAQQAFTDKVEGTMVYEGLGYFFTYGEERAEDEDGDTAKTVDCGMRVLGNMSNGDKRVGDFKASSC